MAVITEAPSAPVVAAILLGAVGAINPVAGASISTIRQLVTPHHLLGRVTAVVNVGAMTALTAGSFAGGVVADAFGLRATLILGGILPLLGLGWLLISPVRRLRRLDALEAQYGRS